MSHLEMEVWKLEGEGLHPSRQVTALVIGCGNRAQAYSGPSRASQDCWSCRSFEASHCKGILSHAFWSLSFGPCIFCFNIIIFKYIKFLLAVVAEWLA